MTGYPFRTRNARKILFKFSVGPKFSRMPQVRTEEALRSRDMIAEKLISDGDLRMRWVNSGICLLFLVFTARLRTSARSWL